MAIQLKDTKFGDTIVTKTSGMYSFDAAVDTTGGFSVTSGDGRVFSVDEGGAITGASLAVAGGFSACGISAGSGGVSMSNVNVGSGVFTVTSSGNVSVKDQLSIVDGAGSGVSYVRNGSMSLNLSTESGMFPVFDVNSICGLLLYDSFTRNLAFNAGTGYLQVNERSSSGMLPVFDVTTCGIRAYDDSGNEVFHAGGGSLYTSVYSENGMQPVFGANICGLYLFDGNGHEVFTAGDELLRVYSSTSSGYYTKFSVDSCGTFVNLGNASGYITTTSVPGSGGGSITVLTLS